MTIDVEHVAGEPPPETVDFPVTVGWTQAAMAVTAVLSLNTPVHIRMVIEGHEPLLIDFRHHAFSWSTPLEDFPVDAVHTRLETVPTSADDPPYFELPGQDLDGLLWEMGLNSFGGGPAVWLSPGERYSLTRWPNLTQHSHNLRQVQMIAVLGNAYASTAELAAFAGVEVSEAQRLINALSLMRILARSAAAPAATMAPQTAAAKRDSLFARLRKRLGR
ncbi:hypothetical protein [Pseudolysinimonas sp.]|uniref:hypothetical protein n=1 Tax=Pseudolysinimonas sp. TaxID=2680009 RepID=UPI00286B69BF|nr:hypothetical protein [Pseudolysinimonas sp.]